MPFTLSEDQLAKTEQALGVKLPEEYRAAMKLDNGGETSTDDDDWTFYSIKDTSDKKRL
ncbi:SMI1/KNR4 family protein [Alteromonas sp. C1M14]|uniref:SMI1/KNR4 family protein n=1 Tax=Alteromonas sp. C1M14 TaxID=2841567 RepID=UPI00339D4F49